MGQTITGPSTGQSALYMGQLNGTYITGIALYYDSHNPHNPRTDFWYGAAENPHALMPESYAAGQVPSNVPKYVSVCTTAGCGLHWTFTGSHGFAARNEDVQSDALIVQSFSPTTIVIQSTSHRDPHTVTTFRGKLQGNRIQATAQSGDQNPTPFSATIPATSCSRSDGLALSPQEAYDIAASAFRFGLPADGLDCVLLSAKQGNAGAQNMAAVLYFQGMEPAIPRDVDKSFYWISKAAAQGHYKAERSLAHFYHDGIGTRPDETKAQHWASIADASRQGQIEAANQDRINENQAMGAFATFLIELMADDINSPHPSGRTSHEMCLEWATQPNGSRSCARTTTVR